MTGVRLPDGAGTSPFAIV